MLIELHEAISEICPIDGISESGNGKYRIDFAPEATPEQRKAADDLLKEWKPKKKPDWNKFYCQLATHPTYQQMVGRFTETLVMNGFLAAIFHQADGKKTPDRLPEIWNKMIVISAPNETEIAAINTLIDDCNIPFKLNQDGLIGG